MYETKVKGNSWTRAVGGRGKRKDICKAGVWVIEHIGTGKLVAGASSEVSEEVDKQLTQIDEGSHSNRLLRELCKRDADICVHEYPTKGIREAQVVLKEIQSSVVPSYLFLGEKPKRKKSCPVKAKSKKEPCVQPPTIKNSQTS